RLIPYASNARLHSEGDIDKLAAAIGKWGWTSPVVVDEEGNLLAGHGRARAAAKLGLTSIPVIVANGWSEEEKRAYRLADDQLAGGRPPRWRRRQHQLGRCRASAGRN